MDKINLYHPRHIESLIVPSRGNTLHTYLKSQSLHSEYRIPAPPASPEHERGEPAGGLNTEGKHPARKITLSSPFTNQHSVFKTHNILRSLASALVVVSLGGITAPIIPEIRLETQYLYDKMKTNVIQQANPSPVLPPSAPTIFDPLIKPDGEKIEPINTDFSIIVPKVGINAPVTANINPKSEASYLPALSQGVAHASTSFLPDQDGTVYLFSHSTNYDWFVKDLNAVFYHLKSLDTGDLIVIVYKNKRYTYKLREKKVVAPNEISYLIPQHGTKTLILQTCWPPGSTAERLLIFADLFESQALSL
jgi:LPXTG-site transpeptidase (sortase) family protein